MAFNFFNHIGTNKMAVKKLTFPRIIISNWWELRKQAQQTPDLSFTTENISLLLNISTSTVHVNVLPALRQFELIDKKGNLTERGRKWLNDIEYKDVCTDIIENVYPVELLTLVDNPSQNRQAIKKWFLEKTQSPMNSVLQMTATYLLLNDGTPKSPDEAREFKARTSPVKNEDAALSEAKVNGLNGATVIQDADTVKVDGLAKRKYTKKALEAVQTSLVADNKILPSADVRIKPNVNINIQLVLTHQTPLEQIDALFSSIGRYLVFK
jgi:hypothetical protein